MKKIISIISIFSLVMVSAYALPVSQNDAQKTASAFFGGKTVNAAWSEAQTKATLSPAYYAFNNPDGGWVIIAGDDCCEPVLAYSNTGSFKSDNLPVNFVSWMDRISTNLGKVRKAGLEPQASIKAKWAEVGATKASVSQTLLNTALWDQMSPYNAQCPTNCYTGCVATAMAIVIRYNQYPAKGTGTIPAYTTETDSRKISAITLGTTYDYANMPLEYTSSATSAQKTAVATLMKHCGAMVQMDYTTSGSGAYSSDIIPALVKYMGYSKGAVEMYRNNYTANDWFKIIKKEINSNHPIIYGGADIDTEDGHQFVLDGYDSNNMVHINWGWSGECNAWYAINYLGDKSSKGVNDVFSYYDSAIIGLVPDDGKVSTQYAEIGLEASPSDGGYGLALASGTIAKGSSFKVDLAFIMNYDYNYAYSGAVKVGLYDKDGNLKEYVSSEKSISLSKATISGSSVSPAYTTVEGLSCSISKDIAIGDYLMAVYKGANGDWLILGGYAADEQTVQYDSSYEFYTNNKISAINVSRLAVPNTVTAGQVIYFEVISQKLPSTIVWSWDGTTNDNRFVQVTSGKHTLKAEITYSDDTTETIQKVFNVN